MSRSDEAMVFKAIIAAMITTPTSEARVMPAIFNAFFICGVSSADAKIMKCGRNAEKSSGWFTRHTEDAVPQNIG